MLRDPQSDGDEVNNLPPLGTAPLPFPKRPEAMAALRRAVRDRARRLLRQPQCVARMTDLSARALARRPPQAPRALGLGRGSRGRARRVVRVLRDEGCEFRVALPEPVIVTALLAQLLLQAGDLTFGLADLLR